MNRKNGVCSGASCSESHSNESNRDSKSSVEDHTQSVFSIEGADCSDEVNAIKRSLALSDISDVSVSLISATVTVVHDPEVKRSELKRLIEKAGVRVVEQRAASFYNSNQNRIFLIATSGILLGVGLLLDWFDLTNEMILLGIFSASTLIGGVLVFPKALRALRQYTLDMNGLMAVAVIGAFAIREYSEGATVVFLFSLAELLEAFSVARAREAIKQVLKLTPQVANLKKGDALLAVPVLEVKPGDFLVIRPGESVPLDGIVREGSSFINQAPLTGESSLVIKTVGDTVFAGTINDNGLLTIEVTQEFKDTKISRVIQLIEEAQEQKAPSERFVDRFARVYTPVVFILAILVCTIPTLVFGQSFDLWVYRALVLLVIACPCALVIATPISVVSGLASLARRGVLVKGGIHLEALGKIQAVALDKTGTLTEGKFKVLAVKLLTAKSEQELLRIAAALEGASTHPLAKAVLAYAVEKDVTTPAVEKFTSVAGRGAEGYVDSHLYFVGNHRYAHELGVCTAELEAYLTDLEAKAQSVVIVGHKPHDGHEGGVLGVLALGDSIRPNANKAVAELHRVGVKHVVILSGDNQKTVDAIRELSGVDAGRGDLLPEDKVNHVRELTSKYVNVAMVGDGVNDAPALANATLGISMGGAGTDAAIETSDVALMQDDLMQLPKAIEHGRRALSVIRFNIGFALATKLVFLALAVCGYSNLWLAVAADMGASLIVTFNALRLLKI